MFLRQSFSSFEILVMSEVISVVHPQAGTGFSTLVVKFFRDVIKLLSELAATHPKTFGFIVTAAIISLVIYRYKSTIDAAIKKVLEKHVISTSFSVGKFGFGFRFELSPAVV